MKFHFARVGVIPRSFENNTDTNWILGQIKRYFFNELKLIILNQPPHYASPPR